MQVFLEKVNYHPNSISRAQLIFSIASMDGPMFVSLTIGIPHDFISSPYSTRPFQLLLFSADFVGRFGAPRA
jgi:hypothetical protein